MRTATTKMSWIATLLRTFEVCDGTPSPGSVFQSLLLPPGPCDNRHDIRTDFCFAFCFAKCHVHPNGTVSGEHWYLIHDDAAEQAGSVLSVSVSCLASSAKVDGSFYLAKESDITGTAQAFSTSNCESSCSCHFITGFLLSVN